MRKYPIMPILTWGLAVLLSGCSLNTAAPTTSPGTSAQPSQPSEPDSENEEIEIIEGVLDIQSSIRRILTKEMVRPPIIHSQSFLS